MFWWARVAEAYKDRQGATRAAEKDTSQLSRFIKVAQEFERLALEGQSKEDPGSLRLLWANAGECYAVLPDHVPAAIAFFKARKYTSTAYHYRMAGLFDKALEIVEHHPVDPDMAESIKYAAKFVFTRKRDIDSIQSVYQSIRPIPLTDKPLAE